MSMQADSNTIGANDDKAWYDLYTWLLPLVEMWVFNAGVLTWRGQYKEVAEDITQEAVTRTFRYNQRALCGEFPPVMCIKSLGRTIARNYFRDLRKKDHRLIHPIEEGGMPGEQRTAQETDPAQIALDRLMIDAVIVNAARTVASFPSRQRTVLLTELANASDFNAPPTLLEQALLDLGLQLRDYKHPRPSDPDERGRYSALLSIAYKRLRGSMST